MSISKRVHSHLKADLWLLGLTVIWGTSFPLVKIALQDCSALTFLAMRFLIGGMIFLPFIFRRRQPITVSQYRRGSLLGLFLFLGMLLQTFGLKYTTASKSGFLTGLCVIVVPLLVIFIEKKMPKPAALIGVLFAVTGVFFLTNPIGGEMNKGDVLTLISTIAFSFEMVFIEMFVRKGEETVLAFIMVMSTGLFAGIVALCLDKPEVTWSAPLIGSLLWIAIICTAISFQIQTKWQPKTSATAAAVIFTMEPVFAALFAMLIISERLSGAGWFGAGLIFCGMIFTELRK